MRGCFLAATVMSVFAVCTALEPAAARTPSIADPVGTCQCTLYFNGNYSGSWEETGTSADDCEAGANDWFSDWWADQDLTNDWHIICGNFCPGGIAGCV